MEFEGWKGEVRDFFSRTPKMENKPIEVNDLFHNLPRWMELVSWMVSWLVGWTWLGWMFLPETDIASLHMKMDGKGR